MEMLKQRILTDASIAGDDTVKLDKFLNHQLDIDLLNEIGKEFHSRFSDCEVTKILTVEASGIGISCIAAQYFSVPVVFAKKGMNRGAAANIYTADVFSFTKNCRDTIGVSKPYLSAQDKVLIIDDMLAEGNAAFGLLEICEQAGCKVQGVGIVLEKGFQSGGKRLRDMGVRLESLAVIKSIHGKKIIFE